MGETCDEINERKYCAYGLVCHQCAGNAHYSCVKCKCLWLSSQSALLQVQLSLAAQITEEHIDSLIGDIVSYRSEFLIYEAKFVE